GIINAILAGEFHQNALLRARTQVPGEAFVQQPLGKADKVEMNVPPVPFQVRVHAGERTFHDRTSLLAEFYPVHRRSASMAAGSRAASCRCGCWAGCRTRAGVLAKGAGGW